MQKFNDMFRSYHEIYCHSAEVASLSSVICLGFGPFYRRILSLLVFVMSRRLQPVLLPQIPARDKPFCLFLSCPGDCNLPFCHKFLQETTPSACFCHVPEAITCRFATDFGQEQLLCFDTAPCFCQPIQIPGCVGRAG